MLCAGSALEPASSWLPAIADLWQVQIKACGQPKCGMRFSLSI